MYLQRCGSHSSPNPGSSPINLEDFLPPLPMKGTLKIFSALKILRFACLFGFSSACFRVLVEVFWFGWLFFFRSKITCCSQQGWKGHTGRCPGSCQVSVGKDLMGFTGLSPLSFRLFPMNPSLSFNNVSKGDVEDLIYLDLGGTFSVFSRREAVNLETEGVDGRVTNWNWLSGIG